MKVIALLIIVLAGLVADAAPDLGVRCISRSPLYWRYNVQYSNGIPYLASTHGGQNPALDQHWPLSGEQVVFTASIRNHGDAAVSSFKYRWYIDDVPTTAQPLTYAGAVSAGAVVAVSQTWNWPSNLNDHTIKIVVDPNSEISDPYRQNNTYTDYTNALSFSIWVEQKLYEKFNARLNGFGTYSFEDWFRWQFDMMKANFARSIYPAIAPNGILERIRVEEINVVPYDAGNLNNWQTYMNNDPHVYLNDGRWQFVSSASTLAQKEADWTNYVNTFITTIDWGLIHEMAHQLGVIDEYQLNLYNQSQNGILRRNGAELNTIHYFHQGGLMGGGYVLSGYDGSYFDSHTAGFLNRNLHYRRGYFGEYLFDVPLNNTIQVTDVNGNPLAFANVTAYQKNTDGNIYDSPVFSGKTDANGRYTLPNRTTPQTTTATGHALRNNPFGQINVVGLNGTMMFKFSKYDQEDFRWFEIIQPNIAYWSGSTENATYNFTSNIIPQHGGIGSVNVALNKPATASSNNSQAYKANDGDTTSSGIYWEPSPSSAGQWWKVDLGASYPICKVVVYPWAGNAHDWYSKFRIETSATGKFTGEQSVASTETNWDETRGNGDYELNRFTGLGVQCEYVFLPRNVRYLRIISEISQNWVKLQEVQVYAFDPWLAGDTDGSTCVDDFDLFNVAFELGGASSGKFAYNDLSHDGVVGEDDLLLLTPLLGVCSAN